MAISGRVSDIKLLISLFGNVTVKEILLFKETFKIPPKNKDKDKDKDKDKVA